MTDTIKVLQRQIVNKLEAGEDISELSRKLAQERAMIAVQAEVEELKKIKAQRENWREEADKVRDKVAKQGEAIDKFLECGTAMVDQLQPLLKLAKELAKMGSLNKDGPGVIWEQFHDPYQFGLAVSKIPKSYLPEGFGCPQLELAPGMQPAYDTAAKIFFYLTAAHGILTNLKKGTMIANLKAVEDGLGPDGHEDSEELPNCIICQNPAREAIDKALQDGRSLRDIEAEYSVSRSSLSRHKNNCLKPCVIRVEPGSPAASANRTFFRG